MHDTNPPQMTRYTITITVDADSDDTIERALGACLAQCEEPDEDWPVESDIRVVRYDVLDLTTEPARVVDPYSSCSDNLAR